MAQSAPQTPTRVAVRIAVLWGLMLLIVAAGSALSASETVEPLELLARSGDLTLSLPRGFDVKAQGNNNDLQIIAAGQRVRVRASLLREGPTVRETVNTLYESPVVDVSTVEVAGRPGTLYVLAPQVPPFAMQYVAAAKLADQRTLLVELEALGDPDRRDVRLLRRIAAEAEVSERRMNEPPAGHGVQDTPADEPVTEPEETQ